MALAEAEEVLTTDPARGWSLEPLLAVCAVLWGCWIASFPLVDNSFLTHLATGRLILTDGSVPSGDPYSFTAPGAEWTVQSWLPSVLYASAERMGGAGGLRAVALLFAVGAALSLYAVTRRCTTLVPRIGILFGGLFVATGLWGERPFMVGVVGLALVWLVTDGAIPAWVLAPTFWVWANSHGSYPLGLLLLGLVLVGAWLDRAPVPGGVRMAGFAGLGVVAAAIGPLGIRVWTFPLTALSRADLLSEIKEWKPAAFVDTHERLYLVLAAVAILAVARAAMQWRLAFPLVAFVMSGFLAQRNLSLSLVVIVAVLAAVVPALGQLRTTDRSGVATLAAAGLSGLAAIVTVVVLGSGMGSFEIYPIRALALVDGETGFAAPDYVGNLRTALYGAEAEVFIDDRVDMYPREVLEDSYALLDGAPDWSRILDHYGVDLVIWERERPLAGLLVVDDGWAVAYADDDWIVARRR